VRGGFAKACAQAINFILRVGSLMVLARLLTPKDFGLVAMVTVVTGVFSLLKDAGLSMATVQRASITTEQIDTLFWINMLVGAILGLLSVAIAPVLVVFYNEPRLFWVTVALATGFIFNAAGVQHSALLQRQMRFVALAKIDVISQLISIAVGIGMVVGGCGYWALVVMAIMLPAISSVNMWLITSWIPRLPHREVGIRSMLRFGGIVTLNNIIVYIAYNFEKVLLGRFWGADTLGIYGRAYQLINIPTDNLNSAIGGVVFSALSRLQDNPNRLKQYFLKGYSLVLALTIPVTVVFILYAEEIILIVLGPQWKGAVLIFRLLTPTVLAFALINPLGWLLISLGLVERSLKIALLIAPLVIMAYAIGLLYGPTGVALGYSIMMVLLIVPVSAWSIHGTMISARDLLLVASRPIISVIVAAAPAFALQFFYGQWLSPFMSLVIGVGLIFIVYILMLLYVLGQKSFYLDLIRELIQRSYLNEKVSDGG